MYFQIIVNIKYINAYATSSKKMDIGHRDEPEK